MSSSSLRERGLSSRNSEEEDKNSLSVLKESEDSKIHNSPSGSMISAKDCDERSSLAHHKDQVDYQDNLGVKDRNENMHKSPVSNKSKLTKNFSHADDEERSDEK